MSASKIKDSLEEKAKKREQKQERQAAQERLAKRQRARSDKANAISAGGGRKITKSLYVTQADQDRLNEIGSELLKNGLKVSESIIIRAALELAKEEQDNFQSAIERLANQRNESLQQGAMKRKKS